MRRLGHGGTWGVLAMVFALVALGGCGSVPSAKGTPITSIDQIAGKWAGTINPGPPSGEDAFYLTISPDRKLVATWGGNTAWGTVSLKDGRASFEMQPPVYEGSITLYDEGDRRSLVLNELWATFTAQVRPER